MLGDVNACGAGQTAEHAMSVQLPGTNTVLQLNLIHHSQIPEELGEGAGFSTPQSVCEPTGLCLDTLLRDRLQHMLSI